jgi:hypothetical protein
VLQRVYKLDPDDCFDTGPKVEPNEEVTVVDCGDSHDSQLTTIEHFSQYGDHDLDEAVAEAQDECADDFEEYVVELGPEGDVELRLYHPDSGRRPVKGRFGERRWTVACVACRPTGRFGASATRIFTTPSRGSGRSLMPGRGPGR